MRISFLIIFSLIIYTLPAQEYKFRQDQQVSKWKFGFNLGDNLFLANSNNFSRSINLYELSTQYMFNNHYGIKVDAATNQMQFSNGSKTALNRISLQYLFDLNKLLYSSNEMKKRGLYIHLGGGYSVLSNKLDASADKDQMLNAIIGFTPSWKINNRLGVNIDLSFIYNMIEDQSFDWISYIPGSITYPEKAPIDLASHYITLTGGMSYCFGGKKKVISEQVIDFQVEKQQIDSADQKLDDIKSKIKNSKDLEEKIINLNTENSELNNINKDNQDKLSSLESKSDSLSFLVEKSINKVENNIFERKKGYYLVLGAYQNLNNAKSYSEKLILEDKINSNIIYDESKGFYFVTTFFSDIKQIVQEQLNKKFVLINNKAWIFYSDF